MARCNECGLGPAPEHGGVTVYRANPAGETPALWLCRKHLRVVDPDTERLVRVLEARRGQADG